MPALTCPWTKTGQLREELDMSANGTCPIWGTATNPTEIYRGDGLNVDSPRAGGKYFLSGTAEIMVGDLDLRAKARLTTWLIEQRGLGVERPEITSNKIKSIIQRPALSVHNRADGLLKYIQEHTPHIGRAFLASSFDCLPDMFAYTESVDSEELQYLTDYLIEKGLLIKSDEAVIALIVTVSGYGHLADLETVKTDSSQAFVAMWFDESLYPAYDEAIEPAIKDAGYSPLRIDNTDFLGNIPDRILAEIRRSRFIVADFTQGDKGNCGGVYYEAGFARGLGISVISTCRKDTIGDVHFDISQDNHILWETPIELKERLTFRIAKEIGDGAA